MIFPDLIDYEQFREKWDTLGTDARRCAFEMFRAIRPINGYDLKIAIQDPEVGISHALIQLQKEGMIGVTRRADNTLRYYLDPEVDLAICYGLRRVVNTR